MNIKTRAMSPRRVRNAQLIPNPVASELILPTVRTRRRAVSRKLIGQWLHLSLRKIDNFGVGKRHCGVQSCLSCMSATGIDVTP